MQPAHGLGPRGGAGAGEARNLPAAATPGKTRLRPAGPKRPRAAPPRLAARATPLQVMKIVNLGATYRSRAFDADDIGELPFGWNIPNWLMRREVHAALQAEPLAFYRAGISASSVLSRTDHALVTLSDGSGVRAKLVLAADGRASGLRAAAGIGTRVLRYGQKALAFAVTHEAPHDNVSTEIHRAGGPCTFVPLPDHGGRPASAVVWMDRATESVRRHALGNAAFEVELLERSGGLYGPVKLASRRSIWPISSQLAKRFYHGRMALIAEAAHAIPPIGAQGALQISPVFSISPKPGPTGWATRTCSRAMTGGGGPRSPPGFWAWMRSTVPQWSGRRRCRPCAPKPRGSCMTSNRCAKA